MDRQIRFDFHGSVRLNSLQNANESEVVVYAERAIALDAHAKIITLESETKIWVFSRRILQIKLSGILCILTRA